MRVLGRARADPAIITFFCLLFVRGRACAKIELSKKMFFWQGGLIEPPNLCQRQIPLVVAMQD